jgi:perosamine synthetase
VPTAVQSVPWWTPETGGAEWPLVEDVLRSNYLNDGEVTERFERAIATRVGAAHAVAATSGTAAIFLALKAIGVSQGDEVIVPDVTFIATANAVAMTGAHPVLVDIDSGTLTLDPERTREAITPRTKAIVPVHVSGRAGTLSDVLEVAAAAGVPVIEDAAEALGSRLGSRSLGTFGSLGCFSFSPNKTITTGQGGIAITDDPSLARRLRELKDQGRPVRGTGGDDRHDSVGYNFKLTNLQAAVGLGQLTYLEARLERQRQIYRIYRRRLADLPGVRVLPFDVDGGECPQWTDVLVNRRDALDSHLHDRHVHCRRFWFPIHTQAPYRAADDRFPVSTALMREALWLPSAFQNTDEQIDHVCDLIRGFHRAR